MVDVRHVGFDLSVEPPALTAGAPGLDLAVKFPYRVSDASPEVFILYVEPEGQGAPCDCSWVIDITYTQNGKNATATIDDGGKPFRVVKSMAPFRYTEQ